MFRPNLQWLFAFIPITLLLERSGAASAPVIFFSAAVSIVPIAHLLVEATERLAEHTGEAIGGLLNSTFGNAPELIIAAVALRAGYLEMVRASLIGAILANLLLAQGVAFLYGGLRFHDQHYNAAAARMYSSMMMLAVISLAIPSAFGKILVGAENDQQLRFLNIQLSLLLLVAYGLYLVFMLKTHPNYFSAENDGASEKSSEEHHASWSMQRAFFTLIGASVLAAFMSEVLVGAAEETGTALGMSQTFIGLICLAVIGGAAESASAVAMAGKDRMDLSIGIATGSSIQIALFVAPMLVLASYALAPEPLTLAFSPVGIGFLLLSVLIQALVSSDGRANWYKGVQLIMVYLMLAVTVYLAPS